MTHNKTILLVEDNEDDYVLTLERLKDKFPLIKWVQTLGDAREALGESSFDLVLLDLGLPDSNGIDTFFQLSAVCAPDTAVVLLTGNDDLDLASKAIEAGAQDFIEKRYLTSAALLKSITFSIERQRYDKRERERIEQLTELNEQLTVVNQQLAKARDEALLATKLKGEFLSNISHEVRTPLSGIVITAELLKEEQLSPQAFELVDLLQGSSNKLMLLLDRLLALSGLEAQSISPQPSLCSVRAIIRSSCEINRAAAQKKGLSLNLDMDGNVPENMISDPVLLRNIFINLIDNAIKFTTSGSVDLYVSADSGLLRASVSDTGPGIPDNFRQMVFDPFVQIDGSTTRRFEGAGLGLALVKRSIDLLGGIISINESEKGGCSFDMAIPFGAVDDFRCH